MWKFCKHFIVLVLFILILLCILVNADFTIERDQGSLTSQTSKTLNNSFTESILKNNTQNITTAVRYSSAHANSYAKEMMSDIFIKATREANTGVQKTNNWKHNSLEGQNVKQKVTLLNDFYKTIKSKKRSRIIRKLKYEEKDKNENNDTGRENKYLNEKNMENETKISSDILASAIICQEDNENCRLSCRNGSVNFIEENLDQLQTKCRNTDLNLMVADCMFNYGILQQSFFHGYFSLGYLSINECNLQTIKATAFKHSNVKNLHTLILTNNQLISLQDTTFDGLTKLCYFEFVQTSLSAIFKGEGFLKPLANNLKEAILQPMGNGSEVVDPLSWWQNLQMNFVTNLDISNTNLQGILNSKTFQPFVSLKSLVIVNCNLSSIKIEVFDLLLNSLEYLDLRFNHLQTLDYKFFKRLATTSIEINLSFNEWYCACDTERMQYFTKLIVIPDEDVICSTPEKYHEMKLSQAIEKCRKKVTITKPNTNTTSRPVLSSPIKTSTTKTISTTETSNTGETSIILSNNKTNMNSVSPIITFAQILTSTPTGLLPVSLLPNVTPNLMSLNCYLNKQKTFSFWSHILKPEEHFSLNINSSTSLTIRVPPSSKFEIIYFTNFFDYAYGNYAEIGSDFEAVIYIKDLKPSKAYTFCLLKKTSLRLSPFDCQSIYMGLNKQNKTWLLQSDKFWFISLQSLAVVIIVLLTSFVVCFYPNFG